MPSFANGEGLCACSDCDCQYFVHLDYPYCNACEKGECEYDKKGKRLDKRDEK